MKKLILKNIECVVSCDDKDTVYSNTDIVIEDNRIAFIGQSSEEMRKDADVIDASGMLCYPGLINTHHHFYQYFSRNLPQVQNMELFDWLKTLYEIWKGIDRETVFCSSSLAMAELMRWGCTTAFDHHYVFPKAAGHLLIDEQFRAADAVGMRFAASRGSMDLSKKDGGLPPDSVVQTVDEIMEDSRRLANEYNDTSFASMRTVALAPCSPFSVSGELMRQSAVLARELGLRLHTHLAETKDEENYTLTNFGLKPYDYIESLGWTGPDVWYAHGIHFTDDELKRIAKSGSGVAHCPISNMKLSSGVAKVPRMLELGIPVGLGVDGSASNDGSNLLEEMRVGYLLHRLTSAEKAPSGYDMLKMATVGGAKLLGRSDIGFIAPGMAADMFLIDSRRPELAGATLDPKNMLATVGLKAPVDTVIINGRITVSSGRLTALDENALAERGRNAINKYLGIRE